MDVKTYRAGSLQEALNRVREELGPDAAVLQTREVRSGWLGFGRREIEIVASADVRVPSRLPPRDVTPDEERPLAPPPRRRKARPVANESLDRTAPSQGATPLQGPASTPPLVEDPRAAFRAHLRRWDGEPSAVADLCGERTSDEAAPDVEFPWTTETKLRQTQPPFAPGATPTALERAPAERTPAEPWPKERAAEFEPARRLPAEPPTRAVEDLVRQLLAAEFPEGVARKLVETACDELRELNARETVALEAAALREFVIARLEQDLAVTGPIPVQSGRRRVVALVGPTGVGKTTTIAKLAAQYRLREAHSVGLVTVDTYRIAAVEQLRTYADILDLPLEVVSSPKEMHAALRRLTHCDLVLVDTAGRGPRDDVRLHELRAYLHEARVDDVHLVLASGASPSQLALASERFGVAGVTAVLLTKLDEAPALGCLYPWLSRLGLPLSYLATGQNVPQDLEPAEVAKFARRLLEHP